MVKIKKKARKLSHSLFSEDVSINANKLKKINKNKKNTNNFIRIPPVAWRHSQG